MYKLALWRTIHLEVVCLRFTFNREILREGRRGKLQDAGGSIYAIGQIAPYITQSHTVTMLVYTLDLRVRERDTAGPRR